MDGGITSLLPAAGSSDHFCLCFWISAEVRQWKLLLAGSPWSCCKRCSKTCLSHGTVCCQDRASDWWARML